jgi:hypothetical protein
MYIAMAKLISADRVPRFALINFCPARLLDHRPVLAALVYTLLSN